MICAKCEWIVSPLDDKARRADHFVHLRPVGQRLRQALVEARRREQAPLQRGVADLRRDRPRKPHHLGASRTPKPPLADALLPALTNRFIQLRHHNTWLSF
jgi:hypothetical protein